MCCSMPQTRRASLIEAVSSVAIGYAVAAALTATILPMFGLRPSIGDSMMISAIFTVASLARSYCLRRFFVWIEGR